MEHTKGRWGVTKWIGGHGFNVFADEGFVASVPMNTGLKHTMRECQANAHLIAAAPDMAGLLLRLVNDGWNAGISEEATEILAKAKEE